MPDKPPISLSVNLNKIALIRNSREGNNPDLITYAKKLIDLGVDGITVHPRPDQRHIRPEDCKNLAALIRTEKARNPKLEFNIEGNPFAGKAPSHRADFNDYPGFMAIVEHCQPDQVTLVPDTDAQLTSDHGFDLTGNNHKLQAVIQRIHAIGSRVSLFMDANCEQISHAQTIGSDRIELYTGPFAEAFEQNVSRAKQIFELHFAAAKHANSLGLGINAGHDLNLDNLKTYAQLPHLLEVSIGHAFTIDALHDGLKATTKNYLSRLNVY